RPPDTLAVAAEGARDRLLEQPLAQADACLSGDDLDQVPGLVGGRSAKEVSKELALGGDAACRGDRVERLCDFVKGQRLALARRVADELAGDVAEIGVALVRRRHVPA